MRRPHRSDGDTLPLDAISSRDGKRRKIDPPSLVVDDSDNVRERHQGEKDKAKAMAEAEEVVAEERKREEERRHVIQRFPQKERAGEKDREGGGGRRDGEMEMEMAMVVCAAKARPYRTHTDMLSLHTSLLHEVMFISFSLRPS
jgi:hypothetical protein